ncbi:unnamed protein product [Camellia sinensis]
MEREAYLWSKVQACGVCHSDLHVIIGELPFASPCVVGHEITGEVVEHGPLTDTKIIERFPVGAHVVGAFIMPCGSCFFCNKGQDDLCEDFFAYNRAKGTLCDGETRLFLRNSAQEEDDLEDGFSELENAASAADVVSEEEDDGDGVEEPQNDLELFDTEVEVTEKRPPQKRASSALFKAIMAAPGLSVQSALDKWDNPAMCARKSCNRQGNNPSTLETKTETDSFYIDLYTLETETDIEICWGVICSNLVANNFTMESSNNSMLRGLVEERRACQETKHAMLGLLMNGGEENRYNLTDEEIIDQMIAIFYA